MFAFGWCKSSLNSFLNYLKKTLGEPEGEHGTCFFRLPTFPHQAKQSEHLATEGG